MDVLGKIVQGTGCAVDGTVAAQNPLSRALDSVLQSQARGPARAQQGRAAPLQPGYATDLAAQMQRQRLAQGGDAQFLQGFEQQAVHRSQMEAAFRAGEAQRMAPHAHHAAMEAAFMDAKLPPAQMMMQQPHMHGPPPPQMMQRPQAHEGWVEDFRGANPMDSAWQTAGATPQELAWQETKAPVPHMYHPHHAGPQVAAPVELQMNAASATAEATAEATAADARNAEAQRVSGEMARTMSQNPDPKFQNSEFLKFMNQVSSGEVELDEEKNAVAGVRAEGALEGAWEDTSDVRSNRDVYESTWSSSAPAAAMESAFADAASAGPQGLDGAWADAKAAEPKAFESAWDDAHTAQEKSMEAAWVDEDNLVRVLLQRESVVDRGVD